MTAIESVDEANFGHKLENLVYLKLRNPDDSIFYFANDADGTECDFVVGVSRAAFRQGIRLPQREGRP